MDAIVVEPKANEQRIHVQNATDRANRGNAAATANEQRGFSKHGAKPTVRRRKKSALLRDFNRRIRAVALKLRAATLGQSRADKRLERFGDLLWILLGNKAKTHFCCRVRGDDGLRALAGVAAEDAVDIAGWP